ncbi:MAG: hypothetical protein ACQEXJ_22280 [Myxococcota bacterium]
MASDTPRPHRRTRRLVRRYLDPRRPWDRRRDAALREHLRDCEPCRDHYRRAVVAHRLMVGGDADTPSGFETRRQMDAVLPAEGPRVTKRPAVVVGVLAGAAAAAALVLTVLPPRADEASGPATSPETLDLRTRGGEEERPAAGLGVSGVDADGAEYEILASDGVRRGDWLRLSYSNDREDLDHLAVTGLQADREPILYAPAPPDETESLSIGTGRTVTLPFEAAVGDDHAVGPLRLVALFTADPLGAAALEAALAGVDAEAPAADLEAALRDTLDLGDEAVVQVLATDVLPARSGQEVPADGP